METCNMCKWFEPEMQDLIAMKGDHFTLFFPKVPMVYREDGGHLIIIPHRHVIDVRFFSKEETREYMAFLRTASSVMYDLLPKLGIDVGRVNYHDNGNFEADKKIGAHQHMHIYGRAKSSVNQKWKAHLVFPEWDPEHPYYKRATHFTDAEKASIRDFIPNVFKNHFNEI